MYVKNSNFAIYLVLAALVGFGISFLFLSSNVQGSLLSGDISKANVYSNPKDDPEFSVIEEKLQNDEEFYNTTKSALSLIGSRVDDLEELTSKTIEVCSDIPEFKNAIKDIISLNAKAYNTQLSINSASSGLDKLASGKKAPDYEQASNNVYIGFQKIENQLAIGKAFFETASAYLEGKEGEEYDELSELAARWSIYCAQDAYLNNSNEDLTYWEKEVDEASAVSPALLSAFLKGTADAGLLKGTADHNFLKGVETSMQDLMLGMSSTQGVSSALENAGMMHSSSILDVALVCANPAAGPLNNVTPVAIEY